MTEPIVEAMTKGNQTALEISRFTHLTKTEINRVLYANPTIFRNLGGTPPRWCLVHREEKNDETIQEKKVIILIDLGNIHSLTTPLLPYIQQNANINIDVWFYADKSYNGPELKMTAICCSLSDTEKYYEMRSSTFSIFQDRSGRTNAADVKLIFDVATYIERNKGNKDYLFVIATKDQGFTSIKDLCEGMDVECHLITTWEELRLYVE